MSQHVPIVDIGAFFTGAPADRLRVAAAFGRAFEDVGFLTLIGHGVPEDVIEAAYASVQAFFALPLEEKLSFSLPELGMDRGYLPVGVETVAKTITAQTPPDLCEALVFRSLARQEGSTRWPSRPANLSQTVRDYYRQVEGLMSTLYRITALALDLPERYFEPYFRERCMTLRFANYPDQFEEPLPGQLRYGAHHDYGGLTLVRQDIAPGGLQVCANDGTWHDAPLVPQSFVVNVGDLLSRWTNGRWRSTLHRVVNPSRALTGSTKRLSLVLFSRPDDEAEIACLPTCTDTAHPVRFAPVSAGAFTRAKLEQSATVGAVD